MMIYQPASSQHSYLIPASLWGAWHVCLQYFHFYDAGGVDEEVMEGLMPLLVCRQLDVVDIRDSLQYDT